MLLNDGKGGVGADRLPPYDRRIHGDQAEEGKGAKGDKGDRGVPGLPGAPGRHGGADASVGAQHQQVGLRKNER